jgi:ABC-type ATPase involved in cell division
MSRDAGIAAALPRLVSGGGPPTQQELRQLQFLWLQGGEAARAHIAQTVANDPPLLLDLPGGVDRDEVMDLIGEFLSCFVRLGVCC